MLADLLSLLQYLMQAFLLFRPGLSFKERAVVLWTITNRIICTFFVKNLTVHQNGTGISVRCIWVIIIWHMKLCIAVFHVEERLDQ